MIKIGMREVKIEKFPDGTPRISIDFNPAYFFGVESITWMYESNEELMYLIMIKRWFDENFRICLDLHMSYIPNGRMDRTKNASEVFTLKYFCEVINNLNFNSVSVLDAHSDVSTALLNNCVKESPKKFILGTISEIGERNLVLYFADAGGVKRYADLFPEFSFCYGEKRRDWKTGKILGLDVKTNGIDLAGKDILMVDDICSYGGSFYYSALALKELGAGKVYAYATHTENSVLDKEKGTLIKLLENNTVEKLFTTNSLFRGNHEKIEVMEV